MSIPIENEKILRLLTQVILADGHIYPSEIEALITGVQDLRLTGSDGEILSGDQLRAWLDGYLQELNETWSTEDPDVTLTRLVLSLAEWPDKQAVVNVLVKISLADDSFHIREKTLISIVKTFWQYDGLDAPGSTIIEP